MGKTASPSLRSWKVASDSMRLAKQGLMTIWGYHFNLCPQEPRHSPFVDTVIWEVGLFSSPKGGTQPGRPWEYKSGCHTDLETVYKFGPQFFRGRDGKLTLKIPSPFLFSDCVFPWEFWTRIILFYVCDCMITHMLLRKTRHHKIPLYVVSVRRQAAFQNLSNSWLNTKHDFRLTWSSNTRRKESPFRWSLTGLNAPSALYSTRYLEWLVGEKIPAEPSQGQRC